MLKRKVLGFHFGTDTPALATYRLDLLSSIAFFNYDVDPKTGLSSKTSGWDTTTAIDIAHGHGVKMLLVVTSFGIEANRQLLSDPSKLAALIKDLIHQLQSRSGDGIVIDFEDVPKDQRANFTAFMKSLATECRAVLPKAEISCALPPVMVSAFDLAALNALCDYVVLMAYNYSYSGSARASAVAPLQGAYLNVEKSLGTYLDAGLNPAKTLLGVPYYGYDWETVDRTPDSNVKIGPSGKAVSVKALSYLQHKTRVEKYGRVFDSKTSSPYYTYLDSTGEPHVAWYEDTESLKLKYLLATTKDLAGIAIWILNQGRGAPELWQAIEDSFGGSDTAGFLAPHASFLTPSGSDLLTVATQHVGERYQLSSVAPKDNPGWKGPWNCSEFASWCVYQASKRLYGCEDDHGAPHSQHAYTGYWSRDALALGTRISVEQAAVTPGAAVLRLASADLGGHIVFSDGRGGTIEAHSSKDGVIHGSLSLRRWDMGILVPWIDYDTLHAPVLPSLPSGIVYRVTDPPMQGSEVNEIQLALQSAGIDPGPLDGVYGPHTAAAVFSFQGLHGLVPDGETGPETSAALNIKLK